MNVKVQNKFKIPVFYFNYFDDSQSVVRWVSGRWVGGSVVGGFNKTLWN